MSVCLSVCPYISKAQFKFHPVYYTCDLWPWLGHPLTAMRCSMYGKTGSTQRIVLPSLEGQATATGDMYRKDMRTDRHETDRHTDTLITMLHASTGAK